MGSTILRSWMDGVNEADSQSTELSGLNGLAFPGLVRSHNPYCIGFGLAFPGLVRNHNPYCIGYCMAFPGLVCLLAGVGCDGGVLLTAQMGLEVAVEVCTTQHGWA